MCEPDLSPALYIKKYLCYIRQRIYSLVLEATQANNH